MFFAPELKCLSNRGQMFALAVGRDRVAVFFSSFRCLTPPRDLALHVDIGFFTVRRAFSEIFRGSRSEFRQPRIFFSIIWFFQSSVSDYLIFGYWFKPSKHRRESATQRSSLWFFFLPADHRGHSP